MEEDDREETTPSGLVVPRGTIPKTERVWTHDDVKLIRRFQRWAAGEKIKVFFECETCGRNVAFMSSKFGTPTAICNCTERVIRG